MAEVHYTTRYGIFNDCGELVDSDFFAEADAQAELDHSYDDNFSVSEICEHEQEVDFCCKCQAQTTQTTQSIAPIATYDEYARWTQRLGKIPSLFKMLKLSTSELQSIKETVDRWDAAK